MAGKRPDDLAAALRRLSLDIPEALAEIAVPAFVLDKQGVIRWFNAAALAVFGDRRGEHYSVVIAPEARRTTQEQFTRKIVGASRTTSYQAVTVTADGRRVFADVDSVRLDDRGSAVGVFGVVTLDRLVDEEAASVVALTPRQLEVLKLLAGGYSTEGIGAQLRITTDTVRNHIRHLLRALGVHSRLEAVARARELRII